MNDNVIELTDRLYNILNIKKESMINFIVRNVFNVMFNNAPCNVNCDTGEIKLKIKNKNIEINFFTNPDEKILANSELVIDKDVIYIDNPFVIDNKDIRNITSRKNNQSILPEDTLYKKLYKTGRNENIVEEILAEEKLNNVLKKLINIVDGDFKLSDTGKELMYKDSKLKKAINVKSLSAGLKTFSILKILLSNGSIIENGTIILDEPEIHLHPQWQIVFAELIVLLQKEFGLHVLLTTHSPYFLNAIEIFSKKYLISEKCNYYLSSVDENDFSTLEDVTKNLELVYKVMAKPFQDLEDMKFD